MKIPEHIKRDLSKHAYDSTLQHINRLVDPFGLNPETLAVASSAAMRASFLALFAATKLETKFATAEMVLDAWSLVMREELNALNTSYDIAESNVQKEFNNV